MAVEPVTGRLDLAERQVAHNASLARFHERNTVPQRD
jgi:hypothetical protein